MTARRQGAALHHRRACESTDCPCYTEAIALAAVNARCFAVLVKLIARGYRVYLRVVGELDAIFVQGLSIDESYVVEQGWDAAADWLDHLEVLTREAGTP